MRGLGRIFLRGEAWWLAYYHRGKEYRESSGSIERRVAEKLLKKRLGEIHGNQFIGPAQDRVLFSDLLDGLELDYTNNDRKSLATLKHHLKPVREAFAMARAVVGPG